MYAGAARGMFPSCPKIQGVLDGRRTPNTLKITGSARLPQVPQVDAEVSVHQDSSLAAASLRYALYML